MPLFTAEKIAFAAPVAADFDGEPTSSHDALAELASRLRGHENGILSSTKLTAQQAILDELVLFNSNTTVSIVNSSAWVSLADVTIPANTLVGSRVVLLELWGDYLNDSGSAKRLKIRTKIAGSVRAESGNGINLVTSPDTKRWGAYVRITPDGVTEGQRIDGRFGMSRGTAPVLGYGGDDQVQLLHDYGGTATADAETNLALTVEMRHNAADPDCHVRRLHALARGIG